MLERFMTDKKRRCACGTRMWPNHSMISVKCGHLGWASGNYPLLWCVDMRVSEICHTHARDRVIMPLKHLFKVHSTRWVLGSSGQRSCDRVPLARSSRVGSVAQQPGGSFLILIRSRESAAFGNPRSSSRIRERYHLDVTGMRHTIPTVLRRQASEDGSVGRSDA